MEYIFMLLFAALLCLTGGGQACVLGGGPDDVPAEAAVAAGLALPRTYDFGSITPNNRSLCPPVAPEPPERENSTLQLAALRGEMVKDSLAAYLVPYGDQHGGGGVAYDKRLQYMSGFSGSNGYAFVTWTKAALWTDGRYFTQADRQMDCNWILMEMGMAGYPTAPEWLLHELQAGDQVGADPTLIGISTWESYASALAVANIIMVTVDDGLVDRIWTEDRPPKPNNPIREHTVDLTGVPGSEQRAWHRVAESRLLPQSLPAPPGLQPQPRPHVRTTPAGRARSPTTPASTYVNRCGGRETCSVSSRTTT